jgi:FAD/FMN-containing dehydrogenase
MGKPAVHNWFGDIASSPTVVVEPRNLQELSAIMRDSESYPSPVRAVGSNHSTTPCDALGYRKA